MKVQSDKRPRLCSVPDCDKKHMALGFCQMHYVRNRKHGDPLSGAASTPRGAAKEYYKNVSLIYEGNECLQWPFHLSGGRGLINKGGRMVLVSRLLCEEKHGAPPTPDHEAAHSCGNGHLGCVTKGHLSWKTHTENMADKLVHGTSSRGERSGMAKITDDQAREILSLRGKEPNKDIAKRFGVSARTISSIHTGHRWSWLGQNQLNAVYGPAKNRRSID